tara:strand:+ start:245 stop:409 length:165 start_codon:yes stop_codon:yes gene_type:complete
MSKRLKKIAPKGFYIQKRPKENILVENERPVRGKWNWDHEKRMTLAKNFITPVQ